MMVPRLLPGDHFLSMIMGMDAKEYRLSDLERTSIVRLYTVDGMSIRNIAVTMGRSYGSIHGVLTRANVMMRSRGSERGTRKTVS